MPVYSRLLCAVLVAALGLAGGWLRPSLASADGGLLDEVTSALDETVSGPAEAPSEQPSGLGGVVEEVIDPVAATLTEVAKTPANAAPAAQAPTQQHAAPEPVAATAESVAKVAETAVETATATANNTQPKPAEKPAVPAPEPVNAAVETVAQVAEAATSAAAAKASSPAQEEPSTATPVVDMLVSEIATETVEGVTASATAPISTGLPVPAGVITAAAETIEQVSSLAIQAVVPPVAEVLTPAIETVVPPIAEVLTPAIETVVPPIAQVLTSAIETVVPPIAQVLTPVIETVVPPVAGVLAPGVSPVLPGAEPPVVAPPLVSQPGEVTVSQPNRPSVVTPPLSFDSEISFAVWLPAAQIALSETLSSAAYVESVSQTLSAIARSLARLPQTTRNVDENPPAGNAPSTPPAGVTSWINGVFSGERLSSSWSGGLVAVLLSALVLLLTPVIAAAANVALPTPRSPAYAPVYPPD